MVDSILGDLSYAEQLMYQAKFDETIKFLKDLEEKKTKSIQEQLLIYILRGKVNSYKEQYKKSVEVGDRVYKLNQKLGIISLTIDSLLLKARIVFLGNFKKALEHILEAENLINSISEKSTSDFLKLKADFLLIKSITCHYNTDHNKALELAQDWLTLRENLNEKLDIALIYCQIARIYLFKSKPNKALDYALKSLAIQEELQNKTGIATSLYFIGQCYYNKANFDKALKFTKNSLVIKQISTFTKLNAIHLLGAIYKERGEVERTLKYYIRAAKVAEQEGYVEHFLVNKIGIGTTYRMKGNLEKATEHLQNCIELSEKYKNSYGMSTSLFYLILTNLDNNSLNQAQINLKRLEKLTYENESRIFDHVGILSKALILKKKGRIRNFTEAELLLKQITEDEISSPLYLLATVNLCELFLKELNMTNNSEVLDELNPLITKLSNIAKHQNAYLWLAEIKLLQAKLALIQMKIKKAEHLITQSQQIAELHGLNLLAIKISAEHDTLLEQLNTWNSLKKKDAPMSERIKLASFKGVIDRMQGRSAIVPPKLTHEIPVLLLIIGEGGFPLFSNSFTKDWSDKNDLMSGFLTAFNSFSGELFAKRLDRAKFGEYTLLMQSVEPYSICYLFEGQTYLANQKLKKFVEIIRNSAVIWRTMKKFYKINRVIELKDHPSLKTVIEEIFVRKTPELTVL
ncbi:MAG: tetratricopeptide repeat protein [Promethearchaeota archaeon]